jgi:hypothetical protein
MGTADGSPLAASPGRAVLVLGMHRSGTSAVAGALAECGLDLGSRLIEAAPDNPLGYFEHAEAVATDERLLDALDRSWDDVRPMPRDWLASAGAGQAGEAIRSTVLPDFAGARPWVIKDPRMCRLLPLWMHELVSARVEPLGLLVLRHPDEVAASLARRDGMHLRTARLLWLRHVVEAATAAPVRSAVVRYDEILRDPMPRMASISDALGLGLELHEARLRRFLRTEARHHRFDSVDADDEWHALALEAYQVLVSPGWRAAAAEIACKLAAVDDAHRDWIDALGMASREAERRRRGALEVSLQSQRRAETLQAALDQATGLARQHASALADLDRRDRQLASALAEAQALAHARLAEMEAMRGQLEALERAKAAAEELVARSMCEAGRLAGELEATQRALGAAEELVRQREQDVASLTADVSGRDAALSRAEALIAARTAEAEALGAELARTQAALADAQRIVAERLSECVAYARELERTQVALVAAEKLVLQRASEVESMALRLECDGLARRELQARLEAIEGRLADTEAARDQLMLERDAARTALERIRRARLWRAYARLAGLPRGQGHE